MKEYKIIAWLASDDSAYCLNCGDLDDLSQPLYRDDFFPDQIIKCAWCEEVIKGETIAKLTPDDEVSCLECANTWTDEPLTEQDFLPGEKVVCHYCGKTIKG